MVCPIEAAPARRTPAARFLGKKVNQIGSHPYRTGLVVENNHGTGPQATAHFRHFCEIHRHIEMLLHQKISGGASGQNSTKAQPVAHPTRVFFKDLAQRSAHRKFPQPGPLHLAAGSIELGSGILGTVALEPRRAVFNDVGKVRQGLDIVHDGRLAQSPDT